MQHFRPEWPQQPPRQQLSVRRHPRVAMDDYWATWSYFISLVGWVWTVVVLAFVRLIN